MRISLRALDRCMGFHSGTVRNLPENFKCFDCRVRADQNWDLIMVHDLHPRMMEKFRDLALFRYVISTSLCLLLTLRQTSYQGLRDLKPRKSCYFHKAYRWDYYMNGDSSSLTSLRLRVNRCRTTFQAARDRGSYFPFGGSKVDAYASTGFIVLENQEQDALGIMETNTRASKSKKKGSRAKPTRRKTMQKSRYVFVRESLKTQEYQDYFNPNPVVERRLLDLDDLVSFSP